MNRLLGLLIKFKILRSDFVAALFIAILVCIPVTAKAKSRGTESAGGGGSLVESFDAIPYLSGDYNPENLGVMRVYIVNNPKAGIKRDLQGWLSSLSRSDLETLARQLKPKLRPIVDLISKHRLDLVADIRETPVVLSLEYSIFMNEFRDGRGMESFKDAWTYHELRSPITYNISWLARYPLAFRDLKVYLVCLAFHEHARHFGFKDDKNELQRACIRLHGYRI